MIQYRLKEEAKQYMFEDLWAEVAPLLDWNNLNVTLKALEEVPQRVELCHIRTSKYDSNVEILCKVDGSNWNAQEKDLCEKALNGELLDIDNLDDVGFDNWYSKNTTPTIHVSNLARKGIGIKAVLKKYLKEKK